MQSTEIKDLIIALSKAQGEFTPAIKDSINPHFKSKFADLASIWAMCRPILAKHNLAVIQTYERDGDKMNLITTLAHISGQWIKSCAPIIVGKMDSQGIGSATSYMRRYSLSSILGIVSDEDDDGEKAMDRNSDKKPTNNGQSGQKHENTAHIEPNMVKIKPDLAKALELQLKQTPEDYRLKVMKRLNEYGFATLFDIPADMFDKIMTDAIKNVVKSDVPF